MDLRPDGNAAANPIPFPEDQRWNAQCGIWMDKAKTEELDKQRVVKNNKNAMLKWGPSSISVYSRWDAISSDCDSV